MKTITAASTGNGVQFIITVDNDSTINTFITTPDINTSNIEIYNERIIRNKDDIDTFAHVNAQISGTFDGENNGNYEYKLDKKYGDMSEYFVSGDNITLNTNEIDESDPDPGNWTIYPPLVTIANGSYHSEDGVDEFGFPIKTTKITLQDDISAHAYFNLVKTLI